MAPSARVQAAFRAMKELGIPEKRTKPVLKRLVKLYDKDWKLIEEENYRVLADAIFEDEDNEAAEVKNMSQTTDRGEVLEEETQRQDARPRSSKRLRLRYQGQTPASASAAQSTPMSGESPLKKPKAEPVDASDPCFNQQSGGMTQPLQSSSSIGRRVESESLTPLSRNKGKQPVSTQNLGMPEQYDLLRRQKADRAQSYGGIRITEKATENTFALPAPPVPSEKTKTVQAFPGLIIPKDEPITDDMPPFDAPLAVMPPDHMRKNGPVGADALINRLDTAHQTAPGSVQGLDNGLPRPSTAGNAQTDSQITVPENPSTNLDIAVTPLEMVKTPANLEIAATPLGEVKISLSCNSAVKPNFQGPSLDEVIKYMDEKCIKSYKILDSSFSVSKLLNDFCKSFLEFGADSAYDSQGRSIEQESVGGGCIGTSNSVSCSLNGLVAAESYGDEASANVLDHRPQLNSLAECVRPKEGVANSGLEEDSNDCIDSNVKALVVAEQNQPNSDNQKGLLDVDDVARIADGSNDCTDPNVKAIVVADQNPPNSDWQRGLLDVDDVTRGAEKVKIPLMNGPSSEVMPSFHYIRQSIVYRDADVKFSLAQFGDEDCCSTCTGDCLHLPFPCACTCRNGGQFAYTSDGLLKEDFLEECISMVCKNNLFYCKECPIERCKNEDMLEPCKGHLKRKFIKECGSKCGCSNHCANRAVQRGISCSLEVFLTPEGKGWGLRSIEELPKGAFVCEYVGEVLTLNEFQQRSKKHSYSMLLDAEWHSGIQKEEQALCLDATLFGNVARFINHRCLDPNLVDIPVEVDTPDHHYYRVALFTTRKVDAFEELTRDYGVDFDDDDDQIQAFRCLCGSNFCRNIKRSSRSRSLILR